jgi:hypothetical protein
MMKGEDAVMTRSNKLIAASVVIGTFTALVWFRAPLLPAVLGAAAAGLLLYVRARRAAV